MSAEENVQANFVDPNDVLPGGSSTRQPLKTKKKKKKPKGKGQNGVAGASKNGPSVFLPGKPLEEGEELVCDKSVYDVYQTMHTGAPCLSFDILRDEFGDERKTYPLTAYIVAGTQAEQKFDNNLLILKLMNMQRTKESLKREAKEANEMEEDEDDSDSSDDEGEEDAELAAISIKQKACINRVRATRIGPKSVVAMWSECGKVLVWDISEALKKLEGAKDESNEKVDDYHPVFSFSGHQSEGFAIDWSPSVPGNLLTGDCKSRIHLWKPFEATWSVDQRPFQGHEGSVEDIQWSPTEATVFASCSVDKTVRVWDIRAPPQKACMITVKEAHTSDVNVISWNRADPFIVSGGDDGVINVWDLRELQTPKPLPVATFKHHAKPVTTVEWNPNDSSVFASGGEDDQVAFWDIAVEPDADMDVDKDEKMEEEEVPPQLLFIHQGQKDIKELHWHPQIPGVVISTALSGFNIFKPISV